MMFLRSYFLLVTVTYGSVAVDPLCVSLVYFSAFFVHMHFGFTSPQLVVIWLLPGELRRSNALFSPDGAKPSTQGTEIL